MELTPKDFPEYSSCITTAYISWWYSGVFPEKIRSEEFILLPGFHRRFRLHCTETVCNFMYRLKMNLINSNTSWHLTYHLFYLLQISQKKNCNHFNIRNKMRFFKTNQIQHFSIFQLKTQCRNSLWGSKYSSWF